jgi:MAE_28990/MAE_18760-like HEPN
MRLRTVVDLQTYLDCDFAWRVREIDYTKTIVQRASGNAQITVARAGLALLYAHWEGFVKSASEALLNFVLYRKHKYRQLRPCFIAHGLGRHLDLLVESHKHHRRFESIQFVVEKLDEEAKFPWKDVIRTQGNLSSEVFQSVVAAIAIDPTKYESRYNWMDRVLLARRNRIAHGEQMEFSASEFPTLADDTLVLLRWFKTDIENSVAIKSYMAGPTRP